MTMFVAAWLIVSNLSPEKAVIAFVGQHSRPKCSPDLSTCPSSRTRAKGKANSRNPTRISIFNFDTSLTVKKKDRDDKKSKHEEDDEESASFSFFGLFKRDGDRVEKRRQEDDDEESSSFSFFGSFKRDRGKCNDKKENQKGSEESSKGFPIIGRFFNKDDDKDKDDDDDETKSSSRVRKAVTRYLESRRTRKDAEELRAEVLRREEERQKEIEIQKRKIEEARKRVNVASGKDRENRQQEVKRQEQILFKIKAQNAA